MRAPPAAGGLFLGLAFLAFLVLAFGVMAQPVWVQWWLVGPRLWRWPLLALACLPWSRAGGYAQWGASAGGRALWWLGQSALLVAGLLVTLTLVPSLGVLVLLLPRAAHRLRHPRCGSEGVSTARGRTRSGAHCSSAGSWLRCSRWHEALGENPLGSGCDLITLRYWVAQPLMGAWLAQGRLR